jgi:hypothetical protein
VGTNKGPGFMFDVTWVSWPFVDLLYGRGMGSRIVDRSLRLDEFCVVWVAIDRKKARLP